MEKTYVIVWKARNNGRTGQGKKLLDKQEASTIAMELNKDYPEYEHMILNTADPQAKSTPAEVTLILS